jgi:hypothetical protein
MLFLTGLKRGINSWAQKFAFLLIFVPGVFGPGEPGERLLFVALQGTAVIALAGHIPS